MAKSDPSLPQPARLAVVGGGMLGMKLACRLREDAHCVTLFEAGDHLGGLADAWQLADITWDRHYHVTLLSDSYTRHVLSELGLEHQIRWVETRTGFYTDGRLHSMSNSLEFLRFPPLNLWDKLRLGWTIFRASKMKNWRKLERVSVEAWLRAQGGHRVFERIWLPLLKCKLGENYRDTSAAFIWATIARLYAARRSGLKKELFGYVPGGYARVTGEFHKRLESLGVHIQLASPVREVRADSAGQVRVTHAQGTDVFDGVVLTVPSSLVPRLCPQLSETERRQHEAIRYLGIVCISLVLSRPLSGYYVTNITDPGFPFTGVIEMTALVNPSTFQGKSLIYLPHYVSADDPLFERTDEDIQRQAIRGLQRMYPDLVDEHILATRISRVRQVMPIPTLDYSTQVPAMQTSVPNLFVVNSTQIINGTLNVNETIKLAEQGFQFMQRAALLAQRREIDHAPAAC